MDLFGIIQLAEAFHSSLAHRLASGEITEKDIAGLLVDFVYEHTPMKTGMTREQFINDDSLRGAALSKLDQQILYAEQCATYLREDMDAKMN